MSPQAPRSYRSDRMDSRVQFCPIIVRNFRTDGTSMTFETYAMDAKFFGIPISIVEMNRAGLRE